MNKKETSTLRVNKQVRAPKVRVITEDGQQLGVFTSLDALKKAQEMGLDLVEIAPKADPPVCKIIDYGKYRYQQTRRDRSQKKVQHKVKVKEIKLKPNIDKHDLDIKLNRAKEFFAKGNKVKFTCSFRGRTIIFVDNGRKMMEGICKELEEHAVIEAPLKMMGRNLSMMLAPTLKEKKKEKPSAKGKAKQVDKKTVQTDGDRQVTEKKAGA